MIDYWNLVNARGGINGVKLKLEECETEYNTSRGVECYERLKKKYGGGTFVEPSSTGIAYALLDRVVQDKMPMTTVGYGRADSADGRVFPYVFPLIASYWSQAAAMVKYIGEQVGGMDKLKGKKIVDLYHDSAAGKESFPVLDVYAKQLGFELIKIPVPTPGIEQQSQWAQIRQINPDFVILWGFGVMNPAALKAAQRVGYPREKMVGQWWAGSEVDVIPAGDAAIGFTSMSYTSPDNFPVLDEIRKTLYDTNKGNMNDKTLIGSVTHVRGIVVGIMATEAIRTAQEQFGKGKVMTSEQVRWGFEHLDINEARLKAVGAAGLFPTIKTSCYDHEGSGASMVQQWNGSKWVAKSKGWLVVDRPLVRKLVEESAAKYAAENNITLRDCDKER
jgi:branched-chain amino acid transport system substrate-binding protein